MQQALIARPAITISAKIGDTMSDLDERPAAAARPSVTLDAVASHLRRRAAHADDEALMLALTVRDLNGSLQAALAENARLKDELAQIRAGGAEAE